MRIDRTRLQPGNFPFCYQMQTRFDDLDLVGHVNNVAIAAIFQEGRNRFINAYDLMKTASCSVVVATMNIEFAADLFHPDPVEVSVGLLEVGRSSFRFGQMTQQNGRITAYAEVVLVARDNTGSVALPDAWRPILGRMMISSSA